MDGVQDLGGMQGFGPVRREANEPIFHADWERVVFGMFLSTLARGLYNLDEARHAIERMPPADYLGSTYYEHWLDGMARVLVEKGIAMPEEIERHVAAVRDAGGARIAARREDPAFAEALGAGVATGFSAERESRKKPRFRVGDRVRVRRMSPAGHTRCPRYVRGAAGRIVRVHGIHVYPDANAHGRAEAAPLYGVSFAARELWGGDGEGRVAVDLWEPYLEALSPPKKPTRRKTAAHRVTAARKTKPGRAKKATTKPRAKTKAAKKKTRKRETRKGARR